MSEITLDTHVYWARETLFRDLGDEGVLVSLSTSTYFSLGGVGTRIWELIGEDGRLHRVLDRLLAEYDIEEETARADLLGLVTELDRRGLVTTSPVEPGAAL